MKTFAIAKRVLTELIRDKRTLALLFVAPLLVLALMSYVFNVNTTTTSSIATVQVPTAIYNNLDATKHVSVKAYDSTASSKKALEAERVDAIIDYSDNTYHVTYANTVFPKPH